MAICLDYSSPPVQQNMRKAVVCILLKLNSVKLTKLLISVTLCICIHVLIFLEDNIKNSHFSSSLSGLWVHEVALQNLSEFTWLFGLSFYPVVHDLFVLLSCFPCLGLLKCKKSLTNNLLKKQLRLREVVPWHQLPILVELPSNSLEVIFSCINIPIYHVCIFKLYST